VGRTSCVTPIISETHLLVKIVSFAFRFSISGFGVVVISLKQALKFTIAYAAT